MSINHKQSTPIERDPNKIPAVVDEAGDGTKTVPTTLYKKSEDGTCFEEVDVEAKLDAIDAKLDSIIENGAVNTQLTGSILQEQLTEADASSGTLTFSDVIEEIEIYNRDTTEGTFTVNGIGIIIPASEAFQAKIGGTPSADVKVSGTTSYVVGRYA